VDDVHVKVLALDDWTPRTKVSRDAIKHSLARLDNQQDGCDLHQREALKKKGQISLDYILRYFFGFANVEIYCLEPVQCSVHIVQLYCFL
jgi:hypothetical protein